MAFIVFLLIFLLDFRIGVANVASPLVLGKYHRSLYQSSSPPAVAVATFYSTTQGVNEGGSCHVIYIVSLVDYTDSRHTVKQ